ncbi:unnamed protein product [Amoebophrya sp. A25]|nr:unnamed protein product [Amoebophrya sp. A25]|eukprot:GSA25T00020150001.1
MWPKFLLVLLYIYTSSFFLSFLGRFLAPPQSQIMIKMTQHVYGRNNRSCSKFESSRFLLLLSAFRESKGERVCKGLVQQKSPEILT